MGHIQCMGMAPILFYTAAINYPHPEFLQFQPEVQQKFFNCRRFDYSVVM